MKISIKNVGPIKSAEIELNGLTLITGLNDTGKSFVGKSLFSLIKTASEGEEQYQFLARMEDQKRMFIDLFLRTFKLIITHKDYESLGKNFNNILTEFSNDASIKINNRNLLPKASNELVDLNNLVTSGQISIIINELLLYPKYINKLNQYIVLIGGRLKNETDFASSSDNPIFHLTYILKNLTHHYLIEPKEKYIQIWKMLIGSVFQGNICNGLTSDAAMICFSEENNAFSVKIENNKASEVKIPDASLFIRDATYIESPIILQYIRFFIERAAFSRREERGAVFLENFYITRDLLQKLTQVVPYDYGTFNVENSIAQNISEIIGGEIVFNRDNSDFEFRKKGIEKNITGFNIASGVKSFGILQRLLEGGFIHSGSMLIIDEPEVHLHPEWQMKYAKIIVELVKSGVPVLINTHSPSMLEALLTLAKLEELDDSLVKVYFGEVKDPEGATFTDVTDDVGIVFSAMSYPVQKIYLKGLKLR